MDPRRDPLAEHIGNPRRLLIESGGFGRPLPPIIYNVVYNIWIYGFNYILMTSTILMILMILINPGSFALHCLLFVIAQGFHGHGIVTLNTSRLIVSLNVWDWCSTAWFGPGGYSSLNKLRIYICRDLDLVSLDCSGSYIRLICTNSLSNYNIHTKALEQSPAYAAIILAVWRILR